MSELIEVAEFDSYKYFSIWLITKYKDNCIYETKFIGNAKREDVSTDMIFSNIEHITIGACTEHNGVKVIKKHPDNKYVPKDELWKYYQFKPITREEIIKILSEYYK